MNMKDLVKKVRRFKKVGVEDVKIAYSNKGNLNFYPHNQLIPNDYRVALLDLGDTLQVDNTDELNRLRSAFIKLEDVGRVDLFEYGLTAYYRNGRKAISIFLEDWKGVELNDSI